MITKEKIDGKVHVSNSELLIGAIKYGKERVVSICPNIITIQNALRWEPWIRISEGIK